jgi:hypothetical protein
MSVEKESGRHKGGRPWVIIFQFELDGEVCGDAMMPHDRIDLRG